MTHNVIFEKKVGDDWKPVPSADLRAGDVTRMREVNGAILKAEDGCVEYRVFGLNGVDPDSFRSYLLDLEPITIT